MLEAARLKVFRLISHLLSVFRALQNRGALRLQDRLLGRLQAIKHVGVPSAFGSLPKRHDRLPGSVVPSLTLLTCLPLAWAQLTMRLEGGICTFSLAPDKLKPILSEGAAPAETGAMESRTDYKLLSRAAPPFTSRHVLWLKQVKAGQS